LTAVAAKIPLLEELDLSCCSLSNIRGSSRTSWALLSLTNHGLQAIHDACLFT